MSTQSWSSRIRHDSDATFREWGSDFAAKMAAVGMVQTADTGQINWATVTRPGTLTEAGYEVWRFNDALQATAPIFFRVGYGTNSLTTGPRIQITVGTGSNGTGTITGTALSTTRSCNGQAASASDTARQSYMCGLPGFFGFNWKVGASAAEGSFFIARSVDTAGAADGVGAMVHWGSGVTTGFTARQAFRYASPAAAYTATTTEAAAALGMNPQSPVATLVGSDIQVAIGWTITPRVTPLVGVCGVLAGELAPGGTFQFTPVGSTARTYLTWSTIGGAFGPQPIGQAGAMCTAMLWE